VHSTENDSVLCFSKSATDADHDDTVIVVVNVDPHGTRETIVHLDMPALGYDWHETFVVTDEISGETWRWGEHNYVRLDPFHEPAHILSVRRS
jgi:starch synthase (maltosyl-transferring)